MLKLKHAFISEFNGIQVVLILVSNFLFLYRKWALGPYHPKLRNQAALNLAIKNDAGKNDEPLESPEKPKHIQKTPFYYT